MEHEKEPATQPKAKAKKVYAPGTVEAFGYLWTFEPETEGSAIYRDLLEGLAREYVANLTDLSRGGKRGVERFLLAYYVPVVCYAATITQLPTNDKPFVELPEGVSLLDLLEISPATFYELYTEYRKTDDNYVEFNNLVAAVNAVRKPKPSIENQAETAKEKEAEANLEATQERIADGVLPTQTEGESLVLLSDATVVATSANEHAKKKVK